ncbi:hypothetical protein JAAARDRAFT_189320 [Jaapia argillacea MUCL 33604]|uniref:Alginate lyase domain-containing protein n=1 Tax=Jaapia argillacea MUCL 33604 TaxID=933084 RepID=A0A067Q9Q3_9AGAM|nr:hypothetical protein JAAARDRAFT_189320 [Jaapia argillacea MUCL 33604]
MPGATLWSALVAILLAVSVPVFGDPNDWVNVDYVFSQHANQDTSTSSAQTKISRSALITGKQGPWTVTNNAGFFAPSGDSHDYLSWAPYHWPNCNWCKNRRSFGEPLECSGNTCREYLFEDNISTLTQPAKYRMIKKHRTPLNIANIFNARDSPGVQTILDPTTSPTYRPSESNPPSNSRPTGAFFDQDSSSSYSIHSSTSPSRTDTPSQSSSSPMRKGSPPKCTPSPTTGMAPSATWTTCPYAVQDGRVNDDVRDLTNSQFITSMSQAVLYNALSYVLQNKLPDYSQKAVSFVDTFFLEPATAMNPNVNFGQLVRGPGPDGQMGTFTGILDLRGIVKVVNSIALLLGGRSPDWTKGKHTAMRNWMAQYVGWLEHSALGNEAAGKPNNHATFFINQLAVTKIFLGDFDGAASSLVNYFNSTFLDQIAISGEQPFEAVRTRPYHYRCFNLEAMITNAKLGDQLGYNFWSYRSKYGATIQTAVDYVMAQDPKGEDATEIVPHVATVAAAYGDPKGKYGAFMQRTMNSYKDQPFWFYDQTSAFPNSPAARVSSKELPYRDHSILPQIFGPNAFQGPDVSAPGAPNRSPPIDSPSPPPEQSVSGPGSGEADGVDSSGGHTVTFECPGVFASATEVEVDDDVFVTCDQLRPFYESEPSVPAM